MALVAVVERPLERVPGAASPPPAAAPPTPPAALGLLLRGLLVRSLFLHRDLLRLRLLLRLECGCDQRLVLGAKVGLLLRRGGKGLPVAVRLGRDQPVLSLEGRDVLDRYLELMGYPCIRASLPDPGADLVQLRL